ncbi:galectin-4-like [Hyperolius riggenbachi]|uniref:galectin-4-like n=1 Tax=Hyperolius riggenbachi TaxID=752182 RepID=UPI0035A37A90
MAYVPAPGYQSAFNPPIPFTTMIAGGLRVGMGVSIQATLPKNYNRFAVNFTTAEGEESDCALHMNARYDGRDRVVFNTRRCGKWDEEEMKKDMPFKAGKPFIIQFEITRNNFLISSTGERFYEFGHRIPIEHVMWMSVTGDILVQELSILGCGQGVKGGLQLTAAQTGLLPMYGPPSLNPPVPYKSFINGGFIPKRTLVVKGVPTGKSFHINLKVGMNNDIPLHFNPRLNKGTLIRNSFLNGTWGEEETQVARNPFKQGEFFDVSIRCADKQYKVFINGSHALDFSHRMFSLAQVDTVEVEGDVKVFYVFF